MKVLFLITLVEILFVYCDGSKGRGRNLYISEEDQSMIVMYHNDVRRNVTGDAGFQELKWDPEIAEFAKDWGKQCIYKRPFDDPYVENLFYKRYRKRDKPKEIMMDAIGAWLKRPDVVNHHGRRGCRRSETCKYVQLSTTDTESVGCTVTECPVLHFRNSKRKNMYYVVCFYKPSKAFAEKEKSHHRKGNCPVCPSGYHCRRSRCVRVRIPNSERIPAPTNPFAKYRQHPVTRRIEAPSVDIVVRNDLKDAQRHTEQDNRLEVQGLPEKNIRYNRNHPAPQNQILGRRVKRQASRNDIYEQRRRYYEQLRREQEERRRRISAPRNRIDDRNRILSEQRRRQELDRERRRQLLEQQRRERLERERERQRQRQRQRERRQRRPRPAEQTGGCPCSYRYDNGYPAENNWAGYLSSNEIRSVTDAHNSLRRLQGLAELTWDAKLQKWANYVIRCDIEYPGPITDYTNFGKADSRRDLTSVVNNWGSEGNDVFQRLSNGCRTPYDRSQCNHYTIMMNPQVDRIGCSSLNCGSRRQLTCIYRDTQARPFIRARQRG